MTAPAFFCSCGAVYVAKENPDGSFQKHCEEAAPRRPWPEFTPATRSRGDNLDFRRVGRRFMLPTIGQCDCATFSRRRESERLAALDVGRCTAGPCTTARVWLVVAHWHLRREWLARLVEASQ